MMSEFICPHCGSNVQTSSRAGDLQTCPSCDRQIEVPPNAVGPDQASRATGQGAPPLPEGTIRNRTPPPIPTDGSTLFECNRVEPIRAANLAALVYGALMVPMGLMMAPIMALTSALSPETEGGVGVGLGIGMGAMMLVLYPIIGLVSGWISGALASVVYNFIAKKIGGLRFHAFVHGGIERIFD